MDARRGKELKEGNGKGGRAGGREGRRRVLTLYVTVAGSLAGNNWPVMEVAGTLMVWREGGREGGREDLKSGEAHACSFPVTE